jgi:hypothetical protein
MKECKFCKKDFKKNYDLKRHESSCKKSDTDRQLYICDKCYKSYKTKRYFISHKESCISIKKDDSLDKKLEVLNAEIKLKELELKLRPNITNNTVNITNNIYGLDALDLSLNRFNSIVNSNYTYEVYLKEMIVDKVIMPFFCNEEGKLSAILSDKNRMIIKCLDKTTGEYVKKDPSDIFDICKKSEPMKEKTDEYEDRIMTDVYGNKKEIIPSTAIRNMELLKTDGRVMNRVMKTKRHMFNQSPSEKNNEDVVLELQ